MASGMAAESGERRIRASQGDGARARTAYCLGLGEAIPRPALRLVFHGAGQALSYEATGDAESPHDLARR